jgi:hypothetical protein
VQQSLYLGLSKLKRTQFLLREGDFLLDLSHLCFSIDSIQMLRSKLFRYEILQLASENTQIRISPWAGLKIMPFLIRVARTGPRVVIFSPKSGGDVAGSVWAGTEFRHSA